MQSKINCLAALIKLFTEKHVLLCIMYCCI